MGIINFKKIIGDAGKGIIVRANPIKDSEGMEVLQEGRPLPGPRVARLSLGSELSEETCAETHQARDFIGKGQAGGEQQGKGTQEDCSATWLAVSGLW